jgi:hypothetical protein
MTRQITTFVLSACLLAGACSDGDDNDVNGDDSVSAARAAATTVDNASGPAYVGGMFTGSAHGDGSVITQLQANLALLFSLPSCTVISNVELSGANGEGGGSLDVAFDSCTDSEGNLLLDGALHAAVTVTQEPLDIVYALETEGLTVGDRTIAGSWEVHHVFGDTPATTWSGDLTVTGPDGALTSSTDANFVVDGLCVTYSLDAQVETSDGKSLDVHADQVTRCLNACPNGGNVTVAGGAEGDLSWTYDGSGQVNVSGSGQGNFVIDLSCQ